MLTSAYLLSQLPLQPPLKGVEQDVNGLISPAPDVTGGGDILTHPLPQATFWTLEVNLEGEEKPESLLASGRHICSGSRDKAMRDDLCGDGGSTMAAGTKRVLVAGGCWALGNVGRFS